MDQANGMPTRVFATVSGSFKRHLSEIQQAVNELMDHGVVVMSPSNPTIVDSFGDFLFVRSDRRRSIKGIENRHLAAVAQSDFLWLCCSDGYVGQSAAMEVGYAVAVETPVYCDAPPSDLTLRQYVRVVPTASTAAADVIHALSPTRRASDELLLDPEHVLTATHDRLERLGVVLLNDTSYREDDPAEDDIRQFRHVLVSPQRR